MKASFATIALSVAGMACAAPAAEPNSYPYSIGGLSLKHLIESNTFDMSWTVTSRGPTGEDLGSTTCHTAWNNGSNPAGSQNPEACVDPNYHFWFPNGIENIENYDIVIQGTAGTAGTTIAYGPKYQCGPYTGPIGNIDTECRITNGGEFYLRKQ